MPPFALAMNMNMNMNMNMKYFYYVKRQMLMWLLMACLIISMIPVAFATEGEPIKASNWDDVANAISAASGDITIDLTADVELTAAYTLNSAYKVTLTSSANKTLTIGKNITINGEGSQLVLKDLSIMSTGGYLVAIKGTLDIENVNFEVATGSTVNYGVMTSINGVLNLYSGTLGPFAKYTIYGAYGKINLCPAGDITVYGEMNLSTNCICTLVPQRGFNTKMLCDGSSSVTVVETVALSDATYTNLSITVEASGGGTSGETKVLTDSNFTEPSEGYFTTAGITVTPSTSDLSFTVACDNACVVAKDNGDGTYTRLTGEAVADGYKFTADSASDKIVVALKGDANGDGKVNLADYALLVLQVKTDDSVHRDLSAIGTLTGDVNSDGKVNLADYALLVLQVKTDASIHRDLTWD